MEPNEDDLRVAKEVADYLFTSGDGTGATRLVLVVDHPAKLYPKVPYLDIGGWGKQPVIEHIARALADQREKIADKVDDMAAEYERQGDYGTINNCVQRVVAANEISAAIRAEDKE